MVFIVTLVASKNDLSIGHLAEAERLLLDDGMTLAGKPAWLARGKAADIPFTNRPNRQQVERLRSFLEQDKIDLFVTALDGRRKKLLVADMDSTIVTSETLDELADHAGIKDKIAPITERAMRGELDFKNALRERVGLLKDLPESALHETLGQTVLSEGAKTVVQTMKKHGASCVLVSGGFTFFTSAVAKQTGFDFHHGNILEIKDGKLTGNITGPILDKDSKVSFMEKYAADFGLSNDNVIAMGDGANDLPMLQKAGLGIGYHPKPVLKDALDNCILYGDLSTALYAQGYREDEILN